MDVDRLLEEAMMLANLYDCRAEEPAEPISEKTDRKIRRMLRHPERTYRRLKRPIPIRILRAAAMALIALGLLASIAMINPDVRAFVQQVYKQWFPEKVTYTFEEGEGDNKLYEKLWEPEYLPEGFSFDKQIDLPNSKTLRYKNEELNLKIILRYRKASDSVSISKEIDDKELSKATIHGCEGDLYVAKSEHKYSHLVWIENGVSFDIEGDIGKDELIRVAESIKIAD